MKTELKKNVVDVNALIKSTLKCVTGVEKANTKLFDQVRESVDAIGSNKKMLAAYKRGLNDCSNRSTIAIMITVAQSEVLNNLRNNLPESYMTQYEILKLFKNELHEDTTLLNDLIEEQSINEYSTKKQILDLRSDYRASSSTDDTDDENEVATPSVETVRDNVISLRPTERLKIVSDSLSAFSFDELSTIRSHIDVLLNDISKTAA